MNLKLMHIQLTDRCPLSCPQCYCPTTKGKDLPIQILEERVGQAAAVGVRAIALSGGEPLVYPDLLKAMKIIKKYRMFIYLSTSGYGLTDEFLQKMQSAGLDELFISINGSREEIHNCSRSEFSVSINALNIGRRVGMACSVNWVAQRSNCYDLPELVELAVEYKVKQVCVLLLKPDSGNMTGEMLDRKQLLFLQSFIGNFKDKTITLSVEGCFSTLKYLLYGDKNTGDARGCGAGNRMLAIDNEGKLYPCRHLPYNDRYANDSIEEYLKKSEFLKTLIELKMSPDRCGVCNSRLYCLPCFSYGYKIFGNLKRSADACQCYKKEDMLQPLQNQ